MDSLSDMIWIELRKAVRSRMPLWTVLGSLIMPLGIAFLIFVAKNPEISQQLGLVSAKANLMAYAATDWAAYMGLLGQLIGAGGFFLFLLTISWVFGREFIDGTLKDLLAVPVGRGSILMAKFIIVGGWSFVLTIVILLVSLIIGALIKLPGGSMIVILQSSWRMLVAASLVLAVTLPFAFFASAGRGYLLPIGLAVLAVMITNIVAIIGYGEYFPWAVPGLYAQGKTILAPISYAIVLLTAATGLLGTYYWWKYADQSR